MEERDRAESPKPAGVQRTGWVVTESLSLRAVKKRLDLDQ